MNTAAHLFGTPSWFCLRTQPKRERIAAENLRRRVAIDVFAPRLRSPRTLRSGLVSFAPEALFPGYLFARFAYPDQLRHVVSTHGVTGIVAFESRPPAVADEVIEVLRRHVAAAEAREEVSPLIEEGTWVQVASGCFQRAEGRVLDFNPRTERVRVLLVLLGREVQVSLPAQRVIPVPGSLARFPSSLIAPVRV